MDILRNLVGWSPESVIFKHASQEWWRPGITQAQGYKWTFLVMNTPKMHITTSLSNYFSDVRVMKQNVEVSTREGDVKMIRTGDTPLW